MKWIWFDGVAHVVKLLDADPGGLTKGITICDLPLDEWNVNDENALPDIREVALITERPFGVDSHGPCHYLAKAAALKPEGSRPEWAQIDKAAVAEEHKARTAAERAAAITGGSESVSMPGMGAPAPEQIASRRRAPALEPVEDLEFPSEPSTGAAVVGGALVVIPDAKPRARRKPVAMHGVDDEDDS